MCTTMRKNSLSVRVPWVLLLLMIGCVSSDLAQDKKQCQSQLIYLSPCLAYVSGQAKSPSPTCCTELTKDFMKSSLCLCILVRDRNEPDLGIKLNATLALNLPFLCHIPANISACPAMLHLSPSSPEARVFEDFASSHNTNIADITTSSSSSSSSTTISRKEPLELRVVGGVSVWLLLWALTGRV